MSPWRVWVTLAVMALITVAPAWAQERSPTVRLTIQIHESPRYNSYYLFYMLNIELSRSDAAVANRTFTLTIPPAEEPVGGLSLYPSVNESFVRMDQEETDQGIRLTLTTDSPACELRYYALVRAWEVGSSRDHYLAFKTPQLGGPLSGLTVSINWPNWKYNIHRIQPRGAEKVVNVLFETDPYKVVSYYWYFSAGEAGEAPAEISVTLRSGAAAARIGRNQSIMVVLVIVCVPTAVFVAWHPPKKGMASERERRFRITDGKPMRRPEQRVVRRGKFKVK